MAAAPETEVRALAGRMLRLGDDRAGRAALPSWWNRRLLDWALARPEFRTQPFRLVDVLPATSGAADVHEHLRQYLGGPPAPRWVAAAVRLAGRAPGGRALAALTARRGVRAVAARFIAGADARDAVAVLERLWRRGGACTVDLLGEHTVSETEADRYAAGLARLLRTLPAAASGWPDDDLLDRDERGRLPRVDVSVKPTALASRYAPLTRDDGLAQAKARLRPLLELAAEQGASVCLDMEHYDVKDLTLQLARELFDEPALAGLEAGVVVQAYLRDAHDDLAALIAWSAGRDRPLRVRLVKGAYWDAERVRARAEGWPSPVFGRKDETDASYERLSRLLLDHHGQVRAAFASHNARSLAQAIVYARYAGVPARAYEIQMLYGMAEPMHAAVRDLGLRLRVYAPVGELLPGMAYLVRRLLENTSNEGFVRAHYAERRDPARLVGPPRVTALPGPRPPRRGRATDPARPGRYRPEPRGEFRREPARRALAEAVARVGRAPTKRVPAVIDGRRVWTADTIESVDPAAPGRVLAASAACGAAEVDAAVTAAQRGARRWARAQPAERAAVLFRAAAWLRRRRDDLAAEQVFEAGKPWAEADADVCEAIDFCEYYGREALRLAAGGRVQSPPGERNRVAYQPRGVAAVISPWNFPLAIPTGMAVAALVTGNAVIVKPAEQTPLAAYRLIQALEAGGAPPGTVGLVPGVGEHAGAGLVDHAGVAVVAFTGSRDVGLRISAAAARVRPGQRQVKRVVAEMGGKNALIVDSDADLDQAVPAIVQSAFGYAGQKCSAASRLVVLDPVYEPLLARLAGAVAQLRIGHPRAMGVQVGPLIDADAHDRVRGYLRVAAGEGRMLLVRDDVPADGWFVGPAIVVDVDPAGRVATEEVFGPLLAVLRAADFEHALALANASDYALTGGLLSRSPAHLERAASELRAGNVYLNRGVTGAVPGRQPFGGYGLSGVGSKAGGPDYLLQFVDPRTVTENTMRQGFAPGTVKR